MDTRRYDLVFDAEFSLVYLVGEAPEARTLPAELTPAESLRMLGSRDGALTIFTVREWDVPFTVEISERAPPEGFDGWEHVVEAAIHVGADGLRLGSDGASEFKEAKRFELAPGTYRVRVSYGGLREIEDGDSELDDDHYRIQLWPGPQSEPVVLKQMDPAIAASMPYPQMYGHFIERGLMPKE
ncbi:MAG: hypothetical protein GY873_31910 [Bosea sp.]|jgi:hypothetical protein|uniref:hypothetical protein n=1 Tax=Hyphomicrobiales TaxID=356 RepID=UPI0008309CDD|nr:MULTISPECIES: hypothetical protein [Hyphomicrobiales]MCP4561876.1 hypothetical protein [Bosea sp. (in: a-proteobacteria)]MCP4738795.1 hypothetical protein [Bosea sp. (in: a-proteobacteria)]